MTTQKKLVLWTAGALALITAAVLAFTPLYLNAPSTKAKIEAAFSRELGGTIRYEGLRISLLPRPHVILQGLRISIPKTASGSLKYLSIYPQVFPLMKGKLLLSRVLVREPDLSIVLPETVRPVRPESLSLPEVRKNVLLALNSLTSIGPGMIVEMDQGSLKLFRKGRLLLSLRNAAVQFNAPPGDMTITLRAIAEPWGAFSMSGNYAFSDARAEVKDLALALGRSSLSGFSARLSWKDAPLLEVSRGRAAFALPELYQWLSSSGTLTAYVPEARSLSGEITLASMEAEVPLDDLPAARMSITGEMNKVSLDWGPLPAPLVLAGLFTVAENRLTVSVFSARLGGSALSRVNASLSNRTDPFIDVKSGKGLVDLGEVFHWAENIGALRDKLTKIKNLKGIVRLSSLNFSGPLYKPRTWKRALSGKIDNIALDSPALPSRLDAPSGDFSMDQNAVAFAKARASLLDTTITGSAAYQSDPGMRSLSLDADGEAGQQSIQWVFDRFSLPPELMVNAPLAFSDVHASWREASGSAFSGAVTIARGPVLSLDLSKGPQGLAIRRAAIKDQGANAVITLRRDNAAADLSFSGRLAQATLSRIFRYGKFGEGTIAGDLHAVIRIDRPLDSTAKGSLAGTDLVIPWGLEVPIRVDDIALHADGRTLTVDSAALTWGASHYTARGDVSASGEGLVLDMDLGADAVSVEAIQHALARKKKKEAAGAASRPSPMPPLVGRINAHAASLAFGRFTFSPAQAAVSLSPHRVDLAFTKTKICGLSLTGTLAFSGEDIQFDFKPEAAKQQLEPAMDCLAGKEVRITGAFDLNAALRAQGTSGALMPSLEGMIDFTSKEGKIYRYPVLAKIFSVLSVLEIFRGKLPELGGNGFPYHTMEIKGHIHHGKFMLEKAYIAGSSLDLIAQGEVDLAAKKLDLVVLVAPFSTINWIIRHIPLVGKIMGGTLISVPARVSGDLADPDVAFLAPSAVGTRILDLIENILELPVEIISPILPKEKNQQDP